jgi:hypothetical protein
MQQTTTENPCESPVQQTIRFMLAGSPEKVHAMISTLHVHNIVSATDWSKPQPTKQPGEVISVVIQHTASP